MASLNELVERYGSSKPSSRLKDNIKDELSQRYTSDLKGACREIILEAYESKKVYDNNFFNKAKYIISSLTSIILEEEQKKNPGKILKFSEVFKSFENDYFKLGIIGFQSNDIRLEIDVKETLYFCERAKNVTIYNPSKLHSHSVFFQYADSCKLIGKVNRGSFYESKNSSAITTELPNNVFKKAIGSKLTCILENNKNEIKNNVYNTENERIEELKKHVHPDQYSSLNKLQELNKKFDVELTVYDI